MALLRESHACLVWSRLKETDCPKPGIWLGCLPAAPEALGPGDRVGDIAEGVYGPQAYNSQPHRVWYPFLQGSID